MELNDSNDNIDYEEIEKQISSQIKEVRSIMHDKYGIDVPRDCDGFIERCLRLKDGKMEKTIKLMKGFHQTVVDFKDWDFTLQPSQYENFYRQLFVCPLRGRDKEGRRVVMIKFSAWNPKEVTFDEALGCMWMAAQCLNSLEKSSQRIGYVILFDFSGITLAQAWAIKQWRVLAMAKWAQNGIAGRVKHVHLVFHPRIISLLYSAIKPFLKEKFKKRILFHDNIENLHKYIDKANLPTTLGGPLNVFSKEAHESEMLEQALGLDSYFKEMQLNLFPTK